MARTTVGQILLAEILPPKYRKAGRVLDKHGRRELYTELAEQGGPDTYREIGKKLTQLSRDVVRRTGAYSFDLEHLLPSQRSLAMREKLRRDVMHVLRTERDPAKRDAEMIRLMRDRRQAIEDAAYQDAVATGNPLALQVASGSRGNKTGFKSLVLGDGLYEDHKGNIVPIPVFSSYGEGLKDYEYFAGAGGARKSVTTVKLCLHEDTPVRMADESARPIRDIQPGDMVLGADRSGRTFPVRVLNVFDNGERECRRFKFRVGQSQNLVSIDCTAEHQILARYKKGAPGTTYGHLSILDPTPLPIGRWKSSFYAVPCQGQLEDIAGAADEPRAAILGSLLGNGCFEPDVTQFSTADESLKAALTRDLEPFGLKINPASGYANLITNIQSEAAGKRILRGPSWEFRKWLREMGLERKRAPDKFIPDIVWRWNLRSIARLLGGLIATDGSIGGKEGILTSANIFIHSSSKRMLEQVKMLLALRFGIHTGAVHTDPLRKDRVDKRGVLWHQNHAMHSLGITGRRNLERILELIPIPGEKGERLRALAESWGPIQKEPRYDWKLQGSEAIGPCRTFDIEVDHPDHLFVLENNLIVSNSTAKSGFLAKMLAQASHDLVVTADEDPDLTDDPGDSESEREFRAGLRRERSDRGLPVKTLDPQNEGSLLAQAVGPYKAGTILDAKALKHIAALGRERILVRSPLASRGGPGGGLLARDLGIWEKGTFEPIGTNAGLPASQSVSEAITQSALCLDASTEVRMADFTVKEIRDIQVGDMVLGADRSGRTFPVRVLNVFDNGERECFRTIFQWPSGDRTVEMISTLDHQILSVVNRVSGKLVTENWKPIIRPVGFKATKFAAVLPDGFDDTSLGTAHDHPLALVLGILIGHGCFTKSIQSIFLSCSDPLLLEDINPLLSAHNLKARLHHESREGYYRITQVEQVTAARNELGQIQSGWRNPAKIMLDEFNLLGRYSHQKVIPPQCDRWSNKAIADLLGGIYATNGSVYATARYRESGKFFVGFGSTSTRLTVQVQEFLAWRFGIWTPDTHNNPGRNHALEYLRISRQREVLRFADTIPLVGIKKRRIGELRSQFESGGNFLEGHEDRPAMMLRRRQELVGMRPTMDLEVDHPDHLFVLANGLIVSNSSKHAGGVAGSSSKLVTGFDRAQALVQTPKTFPGGAAHAQEDGVVQRIDPAPQGGQYVYVSGKRYYAPENLPPTVKIGQQVEAGDTLTEGMANPAELQRLKGIGAARQYLLGALGDYGGRRKLEILVRGLINHVELDDDMDDIPHATIGDVVPYHVVERAFRPPGTAREVPVREALNRYLMRPTLHHTLGTKIKPSTVKEMEEFGIKTLLVDDSPPPFHPRPVRAMDLMSYHPDFMAKQLGSGVKGSVLGAAQRGSSSNPRGTSYASALGLDPMNFGLAGLTKSPPPVGQQAAISHELNDEDEDDEASIGVVR